MENHPEPLMAPLDNHSIKAMLFFAATQILERADGPQQQDISIRVINGKQIRFTYTSDLACRAESERIVYRMLNQPIPDELFALVMKTFLSDEERLVLESLSNSIIPGPALARRCRRKNTSSFRLLLANMVDRGVLEVTGGGYRLASPLLLNVVERQTLAIMDEHEEAAKNNQRHVA